MNDILEYLKLKGVNLKKRGSVYQAICPFTHRHNDFKPSFTVYPETNSFYCFGCQIGGSLNYLMYLFGDRIKILNIQKNEKEKCIKKLRISREKRLINIITRIRNLRGIKDETFLNKRLLKVIRIKDEDNIHG